MKLIQGRQDPPLSETGREHARAAGRWLKDSDFDLILTSPLRRSLETADIIAEETGASGPVPLSELMELDTGVYSGKSLADASREDPAAFRKFRIYSWDTVEGAESREALYSRAMAVWNRLITEANGGRDHIVCVTHGGMLQWIIKATVGTPDQRWMPLFGMSNCGISTFVAESTSREGDADLPPNTGYFGNWQQINYRPY